MNENGQVKLIFFLIWEVRAYHALIKEEFVYVKVLYKISLKVEEGLRYIKTFSAVYLQILAVFD